MYPDQNKSRGDMKIVIEFDSLQEYKEFLLFGKTQFNQGATPAKDNEPELANQEPPVKKLYGKAKDERDREIFKLRAEGLSFKEIGQKIGIAAQTAYLIYYKSKFKKNNLEEVKQHRNGVLTDSVHCQNANCPHKAVIHGNAGIYYDNLVFCSEVCKEEFLVNNPTMRTL